MFKNTWFIVLLSVAVSQAAVKELIPGLTSDDLKAQTQARLDLLVICSRAGAPGNEEERKAVCLEICSVLSRSQPTVTVVQPMVNNLERIGGEESVPTLVKLLSHKDEHIRDDARRALAVNPSPAAAQALGAQLKMRKARSASATAGFIYALGERKQTGASRMIAGALDSRDQEVFIAAVKTLGTLNENDGVQALFARRAGEKGFRKMQIDAALFATERKVVYEKLYAETEPPEVRSVALLGLLLQGNSDLAAGAMTSGDAALQVAVIEAALQGKDTEVCDAVAANIGNLPPHIQLQALGALEFSGNRAYAKAVEALLESSDTSTQDNAARALARIGTADSVGALIANGRPEARHALGQLDVDGVDNTLEAIAAEGDDDSIRAAAIDALASRGRQDLMPLFFKYAAEDGKASSKAAIKGIGELGDLSNLEQLTMLMIVREKSPVSRDLLQAIVEIMRRSTDAAKAVEILVSQMDGASPRSQAGILQALAQTGSKEALASVVAACKSNDEALQKQAVKLLGNWQSDNGLPAMIELAGDKSMSMANHVTIIRGVSRLLAAQKRLDQGQAAQALKNCRRSEERQMIQDVIDKKN